MPSPMERSLIREALTKSVATESIARKLGDELIAAARDTVHEWNVLDVNPLTNRFWALAAAIRKLENLVGKP